MAAASGYWAHSKNERGERHDLVEHLTRVAAMAKEFAEPFGGGEMAHWAGLWHDLGKFHPDFQDYLLACDVAKEQGTRVAILNGRMSDHSFPGYLRFRPLVAQLLAGIGLHLSEDASLPEPLRSRADGLLREALAVLGKPTRLGVSST